MGSNPFAPTNLSQEFTGQENPFLKLFPLEHSFSSEFMALWHKIRFTPSLRLEEIGHKIDAMA
jgi:hypothetical protein